jgi:protein-S-isoprenylcysteine O-methyltransferase Ste14
MGGLLFGIAGRWDLPWFWAYLAIYAPICFTGLLFIDRGLLKERFRPGKGARDTMLVNVSKAMSLVHYAVAALDVGRFHWSGEIPPAARVIALMLIALCGGVTVWAMVVNPFFSSVIRLQDDRGHRVICAGPYRLVRHPGYLFVSIWLLVSGVALGSWWSMAPMGVMFLLLLRRTALEDRFLYEKLAGYAEYAQRVRYRLVPGVW